MAALLQLGGADFVIAARRVASARPHLWVKLVGLSISLAGVILWVS